MAETLFILTERDKQLVDFTIKEVRRLIKQIKHYAEDPLVQSPDILVGVPQEVINPVAAFDDGYTGTGTGFGSDYTPGEGICDVYRITHNDTDTYTLDHMQAQEKNVYNVLDVTIAAGTPTILLRTKHGYWVPIANGIGLVELCLTEDHPGRGVPFNATKGVWNPASNEWDYCGSATNTGTSAYTYTGTGTGTTTEEGKREAVTAIDWRYGTPYPAAGARGLFLPHPSNEYGTIYECVSLDCSSPGTSCCIDEET